MKGEALELDYPPGSSVTQDRGTLDKELKSQPDAKDLKKSGKQ